MQDWQTRRAKAAYSTPPVEENPSETVWRAGIAVDFAPPRHDDPIICALEPHVALVPPV
jgi:hypothetical protein